MLPSNRVINLYTFGVHVDRFALGGTKFVDVLICVKDQLIQRESIMSFAIWGASNNVIDS